MMERRAPVKIVHCSSVHPWDDVRIYHKMTRSLARRGEDVHLVAIDRGADVQKTFRADGVQVHLLAGRDIRTRTGRVMTGGWRVVRKTNSLNADIVHFHDPELVPFLYGGFARGPRMVYDAHEDLAGQISSKEWLPPAARPVARIAASALRWLTSRADAVVAATPHIAAGFGPDTVAVQNFPFREEFEDKAQGAASETSEAFSAVYVGAITRARGIIEMIEAAAKAPSIGVLHLAGDFESEALLREAEALPGWKGKVRYHGKLTRPQVPQLLERSDLGLLLLKPHRNYLDSQPTKLYEYLGAGLPVVVSDFDAWRSILDTGGIVEFVDPADPTLIAAAMERIAALPAAERRQRAESGRLLIREKFNWEREFEKLMALYKNLAGR